MPMGEGGGWIVGLSPPPPPPQKKKKKKKERKKEEGHQPFNTLGKFWSEFMHVPASINRNEQ